MRSLIFILTIAAGLTGPMAASAQLSLLGLKNSLVQFALGQINVPGSLEITVEKVEEVEDGATDLVGLAVADGDGVWLRVDRVSMAWVPRRLLRGELAITKLAADKVHVLRAPKPGPDEVPPAKDDEGPVQIKWPRAPLTVVVDGLSLNGVMVEAGVIGDQALSFDADGTLRDEGDQQTATFNLKRTDEVAGDIRLDYRRDFKDETLRLSLDAKEAAGGLVAALAGLPPGSAAEVHLNGDGPVLDWQGGLKADIGNMAKVDGSIAIPSVQPAQVRLDVRAVAQGEMRKTGAPLLDDPVDLKLDVLADPAGLVTLHVLEVKAALGTVAANGTFDTNAGRLDMAVDAVIQTLRKPLPPGTEVKGLHFAGQVSGLIEDLQAVGKLQLEQAGNEAAMVRDLAVDADVRVAPGKVRFAVKGNAVALQADRLNLTEDGPVTLDIAGMLDGERLTLEKADVASALLTAGASGEADLGGGTVNLAYKAEAPDLAPVASAYDAVAGGAFVVQGNVSGKLQEPVIKGTAALRELSLDGKPIGDVELQHDVTLGEAISGTALVRAKTQPYGNVSADTAFRLQGDKLTVSRLQAIGLDIQAGSKGPVTLDLANTLVEGALQWKAASLERIGQMAGTALAGSGNGSLKLSVLDGKQAADLTASIAQLRAGDAAVASVKLEAAVRDALSDVPGLRAKVTAAKVAAGGVELPAVNATANGTLKALDVKADLSGTASDGKAIKADLAAKLALDGETQTIRLTRLDASYDKEKARLAKPLTVTVKGSAVSANGLELLVPGGQVAGDAALSGNRLRGKLRIAMKDLGRIAKMAGVPIQAGALDAQAEFDTQRSATLRATLTGLVSDELPPDAGGLNGNISADWDGKQVNAAATLEGRFGQPVTATAGVALRPSAGLLPLPKPSAALRGTVKWSGRIETLWSMVPAPDHYLEGKADVDLVLGGTVAEPTIAGKAELTDGRYENLETGTILADLTATSEVAADGSFVVTAVGNDGATSPISARVAISAGKLDASVETKQALLVRRPDLEATVTVNITAKGPLLSPTVAGDVLVDRAEVRLVHATPPNIATLGEVRIKGAPEPRKKPAKDSPIHLDIRVHAPRNIFVRGRGLDSEWKMDLEVGGNSSRPRVIGSIEKLRGQLQLVGKAFELDTGRIFFSGAIPIDPGLDVKLLRENDGIRGGIAVSGNASDVKIEFVSTPSLPQGEVMPRVLFGRSRQSLSALEALELASGIATLMDGSGGTVDQVRSAIGLDVLRVEDTGNGASVTVGKNIQDGVFVGASQPLDGSSATFRIEIEIYDNLAVESDLGHQGGTSVGVKWKKDF